MSFNYKSHQLLTGNRTTQFKVITGEIETRYILLRDSNYYGLLNPNKPFEIYSLVPSKKRNIPDYIGEGSNVQIHLNEEWIITLAQMKVNFSSKKLSFPQKTIEIKVHTDRADSFFIPNFSLLAPNKYIYTDMNKLGEVAIILVENKISKVIKKFPSIHSRIQFCENKKRYLHWCH